MSERPDPTPEGDLLRSALKRSGLSAREAAKRAGISYGRWHQIVNGYQSMGGGVFHPVREVPAETIARMANVFDDVTPGQLEEAGRTDAAAELRELGPPDEPIGDSREDRLDRAERMLTEALAIIKEERREAG